MSDTAQIDYLHMGPWPTYVGFTTSAKAFNREMKRLGLKAVPFMPRERANAAVHRLEHGGALTQIICIRPKGECTFEQYAAMLAHEAMHVVQELRAELNRDEHLGHEAEAYLMQHIVQECLQIALKSPFARRTEPV